MDLTLNFTVNCTADAWINSAGATALSADLGIRDDLPAFIHSRLARHGFHLSAPPEPPSPVDAGLIGDLKDARLILGAERLGTPVPRALEHGDDDIGFTVRIDGQIA